MRKINGLRVMLADQRSQDGSQHDRRKHDQSGHCQSVIQHLAQCAIALCLSHQLNPASSCARDFYRISDLSARLFDDHIFHSNLNLLDKNWKPRHSGHQYGRSQKLEAHSSIPQGATKVFFALRLAIDRQKFFRVFCVFRGRNNNYSNLTRGSSRTVKRSIRKLAISTANTEKSAIIMTNG